MSTKDGRGEEILLDGLALVVKTLILAQHHNIKNYKFNFYKNMYTVDSVEKKDNKTKVIAIIIIVISLIGIFFFIKNNYWGEKETEIVPTEEEKIQEIINSLTPTEEMAPLAEEEKATREDVLNSLTPQK
jgi:ABC-type cobalt transport system substrate-binding protein